MKPLSALILSCLAAVPVCADPGTVGPGPVESLAPPRRITPAGALVVESPPAPPESADSGAAARLEHLEEALRHLRAAGLPEQADQIEARQLELRVEALREKRQQAARLLDEIDALERSVGAAHQIVLTCKILGIPRSVAAELPLGDGPRQPAAAPCPAFALLDSAELRKVIAAAEQGNAKTFADTTLVVQSGRPGTMRAGGSFPILIPVDEDKVKIEYRDLGATLEAVAIDLANGKVRLQLAAENSERDVSTAATVRGTLVPGISTRRFNTEVEMAYGQTLVTLAGSGQPAAPAEGVTPAAGEKHEPVQTMFVITVQRGPGE